MIDFMGYIYPAARADKDEVDASSGASSRAPSTQSALLDCQHRGSRDWKLRSTQQLYWMRSHLHIDRNCIMTGKRHVLMAEPIARNTSCQLAFPRHLEPVDRNRKIAPLTPHWDSISVRSTRTVNVHLPIRDPSHSVSTFVHCQLGHRYNERVISTQHQTRRPVDQHWC